MQIKLSNTALSGQFQCRHDLVFVAVDAAR